MVLLLTKTSLAAQIVKKSAWNTGRSGFTPWVRKIPWRREWPPIPVFLPGEFHGQKSLAGYSPWGCKESDMTDRPTLSLSLHVEFKGIIMFSHNRLLCVVPGSSLGRIQGVPSGWMASARERQKTRETSLDRAKSVFYFLTTVFIPLLRTFSYPYSERFQGTRCLLMLTQD